MPKRIIDGEAMYGSDKLHRCPLWIRKEYPWLYPLADCNGNFELNLRVIAGKLWPNRPDLTEKKLEQIFQIFNQEGLAFVWEVGGRRYLHWTASERIGRLPPPSQRSRKYEKTFAPTIPPKPYRKYLQQFSEKYFLGEPKALPYQAKAKVVGLGYSRARVGAKATATEEKPPPAPNDPPFFRGQKLRITPENHKKLLEAYPNLKLEELYKQADLWLVAKKKTRKNALAFMRNWCAKESDQQKGGMSRAEQRDQRNLAALGLDRSADTGVPSTVRSRLPPGS